jgi:hypothetical protein
MILAAATMAVVMAAIMRTVAAEFMVTVKPCLALSERRLGVPIPKARPHQVGHRLNVM